MLNSSFYFIGYRDMNKYIGVSILLLTLSGCAIPPEKPIEITQPTPSCSSKEQCDAMWIDAAKWVKNLTGMKLASFTDVYGITYPTRGPGFTGEITREPQPDGTTKIQGRFYCPRSTGCNDLISFSTNSFNEMVSATGKKFNK